MAPYGAAMYFQVETETNSPNITVYNCSFINNIAYSKIDGEGGGGIYFYNS